MIELDHKIKDTTLHFSFSDTALRLFARKKGVSNIKATKIGDLLNDLSIDEMDLLFWCGLKEGGAKSGDKFTLTVEELGAELDEEVSFYDELVKAMNEQSPSEEEDSGNVEKGKG